ncbi:MAG: hypothetical protein HGA85_03690 [Nanoarchaeota archaeon]|nr:hypothetical protein [Nanoarchaeota archaeon]
MKYKAKSAIIGRAGKRDDFGNGPVFIHLFNINDPHKTKEVPVKFIDFAKMHKVVFRGLDVNFLLAGSDILINDLEHLEVEEEKGKPGNLVVTGKQA